MVVIIWHNNERMETQKSHADLTGLDMQKAAKFMSGEGIVEQNDSAQDSSGNTQNSIVTI
jgi:hypothetical protein